MKKIILTLSGICFSIFCAFGQYYPYTDTSVNFQITSYQVSNNNINPKSVEVKFEVRNDTVVLIDSFYLVRGANRIQNFVHTSFTNDTVYVGYYYIDTFIINNTPVYITNTSCSGNGGILDTISTHSFKLMHVDSFITKTIVYKSLSYSITNIGNQQIDYTPKEKNYIPFTNTGGFLAPPNCPAQVSISNDSVYVHYVANHTYAEMQLSQNLETSPDTLDLSIRFTCGSVGLLEGGEVCYKIYVGDSSNIDTLDVGIINNADYNGAPTKSWYRIINTPTGISYFISGAVPAVGLQLEAQRGINIDHLYWSTISEKNTSHYNVMTSYDGIHFKTIGTIKAAGFSNQPSTYEYEVPKENQDIYYRIDLMDIDLKQSSSNVVYLAYNELSELSVFPNPNEGTFHIQGDHINDYKFTLSSLDGRVLLKDNIQSSNTMFPLNIKSYPKGIYILSLQHTETHEIITHKVIKE